MLVNELVRALVDDLLTHNDSIDINIDTDRVSPDKAVIHLGSHLNGRLDLRFNDDAITVTRTVVETLTFEHPDSMDKLVALLRSHGYIVSDPGEAERATKPLQRLFFWRKPK